MVQKPFEETPEITSCRANRAHKDPLHTRKEPDNAKDKRAKLYESEMRLAQISNLIATSACKKTPGVLCWRRISAVKDSEDVVGDSEL